MFYLIDSIVNSETSDDNASSYKNIFGGVIENLFMDTYSKLPQIPELKKLFAELLSAWTTSERFDKPVLDSLNARFQSFKSREVVPPPLIMPFQVVPQQHQQQHQQQQFYQQNPIPAPIPIPVGIPQQGYPIYYNNNVHKISYTQKNIIVSVFILVSILHSSFSFLFLFLVPYPCPGFIPLPLFFAHFNFMISS